eukprot:3553827-Pyramimonas_sp.AAC.2
MLVYVRGSGVDARGYGVDVRGSGVDVRGYGVDARGYGVDVTEVDNTHTLLVRNHPAAAGWSGPGRSMLRC